MTREQAFLWIAEAVMVSALICFLRGFAVRKSDNRLHQRMGKLGTLLVLVGLAAVEFFHRGLKWEFPIRSYPLLHAHITVACAATLVLAVVVWTGMRGPKTLHVKLWPLFFPLFIATIVLSLMAFKLV